MAWMLDHKVKVSSMGTQA